MTLKYLIQKEFLQIRRNAFLPRLIVLFPVVIMCVTPWIMNMEVRNVKVEVVDNDRSALSRQIVNSIAASKYFIFNGQRDTYNEALEDIELSKTDIILVIPQKFGRDMDLGIRRQVLIAANAVNGTKGAIGSIYLSQIVTEKADPDVEALQKKVTSLFLYNKKYDFKLFMIPALFAIVMMLMTGYLPALNIVGEKEAGTIEQINVTPVSKLMFILAKLIPYWLISIFVITVCLILAWLIYGITSAGPIWLIYVLAILLALFFSSFGLIILFRHHAAGYLRHVVLCCHDVAAVGAVHPYALNAGMGIYDNIYQPGELFRRSSKKCVHPRWKHHECMESDSGAFRHRTIHGHLGGAEL